jgi:hypothetical protein
MDDDDRVKGGGNPARNCRRSKTIVDGGDPQRVPESEAKFSAFEKRVWLRGG